MAKLKTVAVGIQDFADLIQKDYFYVDKTMFLKEWWGAGDAVTLITRPRRFGKTLTISMTERFFSNRYDDQGELFRGLSIWEDEKYRNLAGKYPVISLSFAGVKENTYEKVRAQICMLLSDLFTKYSFIRDSDILQQQEKDFFDKVSMDMNDTIAAMSLNKLSDYLQRYYNKKVIILLDEYDTPMQEAYVGGFLDELVSFTRNLFNNTFKTNLALERGLMTGITRVSRESLFSDLNNLKVVTTTSKQYAVSFGFTEDEVFSAMDEYGYTNKDEMKAWYDGFIFGDAADIYNPWSVINFLQTGEVAPYWVNTGSNHLISKLIREGGVRLKGQFQELLEGGKIRSIIDEQIVFHRLDGSSEAIWSLLLASGYLKPIEYESAADGGSRRAYTLALTNYEVKISFENMVRSWFGNSEESYNDFILALLAGNIQYMNYYMNKIALQTFSYFDTGASPSGSEPERFYHGFVLGLMVDLQDRYIIKSNRESGFGRYDVMMEPKDPGADNAVIIEFKVRDAKKEASLEATVREALKQIEDRRYAEELINRGFSADRIRRYGFAFEGKNVLIGE